MISSTCWVPRGFAAEFPEKYELDDEEMARINAMANLQLEDAKEQLKESEESGSKLKDQITIDDDLKEYDLEHYDSDKGDGEDVSFFPGLSNTNAKIHFDDEGNDPYLSLPTDTDLQEEKQELQIYPTDNLVLATRTEDDISYLDVYVYDDGAGVPEGVEEEEEDKIDPDVAKGLLREANLYIHHDIMLPAFPLCVEWLNFQPGSSVEGDNLGNFAAIGTFDPQIEIWNLDCVDKAFPDLILGEPEYGVKKSSKKKKKSKGHITSHHTAAVLSLSHNKGHRNVLASTSADTTVKLWDLSSGVAVTSFNTIHSNTTVSSSQWHLQEHSILLTGGYDSTCGISDVRISGNEGMTKSYGVSKGEEVENVAWAGDAELAMFYAGTDNGNVYAFDARNQEKPIWTLHAHDSGISSLSANTFIPGMLITSAMSESVVKLWKCSTSTGSGPSMILSKDFGIGNVLSTSFGCEIEITGKAAVGGVSGGLKLWDTLSNKAVRNAFSKDLSQIRKRAREEARAKGRASRLARKYQGDIVSEDIITVEEVADNESEDELSDSN